MPKNTKKRQRGQPERVNQPASSDSDDSNPMPVAKGAGKQKGASSSSRDVMPPRKKAKMASAEPSDEDIHELEHVIEEQQEYVPKGSAVIDIIEGDNTPTWETASIPEKEAQAAVDSLLSPFTFEQFVSDYWETRTPAVIKCSDEVSKKKAGMFGISGPNDLIKLVAKADGNMRFRTDVAVTRWDPENDEIEEATADEPDEVESLLLTQMMQDNWSLSVFHLHSLMGGQLAPKVHDFIRKIDTVWRGEGSCSTQLTVVPPGTAPFGAYSHPRDRLIVQIQGKQRVQVFYPAAAADSSSEYQTSPDNGASQIVTSYPLHTRGPFPLTVHQVDALDIEHSAESDTPRPASIALDTTLKSGDVLFVPKDFLIFTEPAQPEEDDEDEDSEEEIDPKKKKAQAKKHNKQPAAAVEEQDPGSMDMTVILSTQSSPLKLAQQLLAQEYRHHTAFLRPEDVAKASSDLLRSAINNVDTNLRNHVMSRTKYSFKNFDVQKWIESRYGNGELARLVEESDGLVKIRDFLPQPVAEAIHDTLSHLNNDEWYSTEARADQSQNNIAHRFLSAKQFPNSDSIFSIFRALLPGQEATFSAGRYNQMDHIDPHDDRAFKQIAGETYSRDIAVIYYLTPDWTAEDGGALIDLDGGEKKFVPEFNSAVAFKVPRWHQVEAVKVLGKSRYSIFGWFLQPGQLYELSLGEEDGEEGDEMADFPGYLLNDSDEEDEEEDSQEAPQAPPRKQQRKKKGSASHSHKQKDEPSVD